MRWGTAILAAALMALGLGSTSAHAASGSAAAQDDEVVLTSSFTPFAQPSDETVTARASIAPGVFAVAVAVRTLTALRAARVAAAARAATLAQQATNNFIKVKRATISRTLRELRKVPRTKKAIKKAWPTLSATAQGCLATSVFSKTTNWLIDGKIDVKEWNQYTTWGPRLVPPTESLGINFPIVIKDDASPGKIIREEVVNCVIGAGVGAWIQRGSLKPR